MTFQDLGSIGELIAAVATLITLAYLALQLKQNTTALKSQTFQQSMVILLRLLLKLKMD